jgi:hypothetical protein
MIGAVRAIPLTVEVIVLPELLNRFVVAAVIAGPRLTVLLAIPFTVLVKLLPDNDNALVLIIGTVAPVTPLTVVDKTFPEEVLLTVFTAVVLAATPFTVEVIVLPVEPNTLVVIPEFFANTHLVPSS